MEVYKYLGYHMHEHLSHSRTVEILTNSAKRAFGRVINIFKCLGNMGHKTYETLIYSNVFSIANYGAGLWRYKEHQNSRVLQNTIERYYLGTHRFTPLAATYIEMDWADNRYMHWVEMLRLKNRINGMTTGRWPRKVFQWDRQTNTNAWGREISLILKDANMTGAEALGKPVDLESISISLHGKARNQWYADSHNKEKLRTFVEIHNFEDTKQLISNNLSRTQRSLVFKFKSGVLPLKIETGRFKGTGRELRFCDICNAGTVEDEMHYLYFCDKLKYVRKRHSVGRQAESLVESGSNPLEVTKMCLFEDLKGFANWLEDSWKERKKHLYK